jgi:23S rRNA pseudouridine2604 synthase
LDISLNKYISDSGYCSRREADRLIEAGRVLLNNEIAVTGNRYQPGDEVVVDGSIVKPAAREKRLIMAFNKPAGITTTTDTNIRGNIISYINYPKRIFPIGRLDKDSEGLIFLTNDGDVVNKILRAGNEHEKEYSVKVDKAIDGTFLRNMSEGVRIEGTKTLPCKLKQTGRHSFNIILIQGLNRQIRKMCEALGFKVTHLQRTRIMHVKLDKLAVGKWRYLSEPEMEALYGSVEGSVKEAGGVGREVAGKSEQGAVSRKQKAGGERREVAGKSEQKAVISKQEVGGERRQEGGRKKKSGSYKDFRKRGKK